MRKKRTVGTNVKQIPIFKLNVNELNLLIKRQGIQTEFLNSVYCLKEICPKYKYTGGKRKHKHSYNY